MSGKPRIPRPRRVRTARYLVPGDVWTEAGERVRMVLRKPEMGRALRLDVERLSDGVRYDLYLMRSHRRTVERT